ncbi:MAG: riboflavin synthase [Firmicutes bacterium]|nr:riboflavin synthase [Bacillota bacterium]
MFTGIIEEVGTIKSMTAGESSGEIRVQARTVLEGTKIGDSIAVNGICLTVTSLQPDGFTADVMAETVRRSALREQNPGSKVNLERAMAADGRFGGHMVSGHIDGTGKVVSLEREENAVWVTIEAPAEILRLIVEKGSIAIDGISLTVAYVDERVFKVSIIPHTGAETTLLDRKAGDSVNLENDITGKYVEKLLAAGVSTPYSAGSRTGPEDRQRSTGEDGLTIEYLEKMGI